MPIKILINGANGRMGQAAVATINHTADFRLVGTAQRGDDLMAKIKASQAEVVLDLTTASAVYENLATIIAANAHPVIGTSGLTPTQVKELQQRCAEKQLGGIIAPNFSIGAILMMRFAQMAAPYFAQVEIVEMHHPDKADAPSGTAIKTAQLIASAQGEITAPKAVREIIPGSRGAFADNIPIHALRLPGIVASQEVIFGGPGETLSIKDCAINREAYMAGICFACRKVMSLKELVYGLEQLV